MSTAPSRNGNSRPRSFVIPSLVSSSSLVAKFPSVTTTRGEMKLELRLEVGPAGLDLDRLGVAVARRAALHDVGDVDVGPGEADALDQAGEQLAGPADERLALQVLLLARPLAHEQQVGARDRRPRRPPGSGSRRGRSAVQTRAASRSSSNDVKRGASSESDTDQGTGAIKPAARGANQAQAAAPGRSMLRPRPGIDAGGSRYPYRFTVPNCPFGWENERCVRQRERAGRTGLRDRRPARGRRTFGARRLRRRGRRRRRVQLEAGRPRC